MDPELRSKIIRMWLFSSIGPMLLVGLVVQTCLTQHPSTLTLWLGFAPPTLLGTAGTAYMGQRAQRALVREHQAQQRAGRGRQ